MITKACLAARKVSALPRIRKFSTAQRIFQKKTDPLHLQHPLTSTSKKRILILSPKETEDKTISRYVDNMSRSVRKKKMPKHILQLVEGNVYDKPWDEVQGPLEDNIDQFKPTEYVISSFRAHSLIDTLALGFKKDQLLAYVKKHGMPMSKKNKHQIADTIVRKIWKHKVPLKNKKYRKELLKRENQILKEEYLPVSKFEIFMLLSQQGKLWKDIKSTLSSIKFTNDKTQLKMGGSDSQLENARILISTRIDNCYREEVDLSSIKKLYEEKFGTFSVKSVGKFTELYFTHLEGDKYELASLNPNQIKRVRRLFLWHLGYNLHRKEQLHLPSPDVMAECSLLPYTNDYSVSWKERGKPFFTLKSESIPSASEALKEDLERFSDESLSQMESRVLDSSYSFGAVSNSKMAKETYDLLQSIGLMEEDLGEKDTKNELTDSENEAAEISSISQTPRESPMRKLSLSNEERDLIYKELTDFLYRKSLNGVSESQLEDPVFTVTLGGVLFEKDVSDKRLGIESPSKESLDSRPHIFNTNVTLAFDHALSSTITKPEAGSLDEDPHVYSLQFKFVPSPYVEEFGDKTLQRSLEEQIKYPPVEMWVQLNSQSVPDLETLQVVTVEAENNSLICCPQAKSDMRVGCQITGRLLEDDAVKPAEEESTLNIEAMLQATTSKYARFSKQSGIVDFLEKSELDFSGRKPTSIAPWIVLDINGQKVRYDYVNTSYRQELTLETEDDMSVQLAVVDGGLLGGRRLEVRFIGDYTAGLDRGNFDKLLDYTVEFINKL